MPERFAIVFIVNEQYLLNSNLFYNTKVLGI